MKRNKTTKINLIKSAFDKEERTRNQLARFVKTTPFFSMNKECKKFEENFAKKQQREYAIFFNSGSSANLALIQAMLNLGLLKKDDPVGFSSLTWATNVMPLIQLGLNPIPIDCNLRTLNTDKEHIEKNGKKIRCLFLTNALGFSDNLQEISKYCKNNNILLIEDNCESLGSQCNGTLLGNFGIASTFSFFVGHHMSTIEGGMVCTDNEELANMLIMVRAHGWDRNLEEKKKKKLRKINKISPFYGVYTFYDLGFNFRPNELNGFLGNVQLKYLDNIIEKRFKNYKFFFNMIKNSNKLISLDFSHMNVISNFAFPLIFKSESTFKKYRDLFFENGIEVRPIIAGDITRQPFFKKYLRQKSDWSLPNTAIIHRNGFYFGNNQELTKEERTIIGNLLSDL